MKLTEVPAPNITENNDVLIKIKRVGVCGSDIHYYKSGRIGDRVIKYPFPVGHEAAGTVHSAGEGVTGLKPGDRVAIDPAMPCWKCDQCIAGRHHTCKNLRFLGCPGQADGCLSEYIVIPETSCFHIPDNVSFDQAVISEPLAIGIYSVLKSGPFQDKKIGILGFGPIGMSVFLSARNFNIKDIYITDKVEERLAIARKTGATWAGNPDKTDVVSEILKQEPLQLDIVFECCGQQEAVDQAIDLLKPGGKLVIVGIPESDRWTFSVDKTRRKEITIQNIRRQVDCTKTALNMIANDVDVSAMITHHFRYEDTEEAFKMVSNYEDGVMKAIIDFDNIKTSRL